MNLLLALGLWIALSIPVGILVGKAIKAGRIE